jgi:hypothetical protein
MDHGTLLAPEAQVLRRKRNQIKEEAGEKMQLGTGIRF